MKNKNNRKTEYIDPEVQGALARRLILQWMLFVAVAAVLTVGLKWMSDPFAPLGQTFSEAWWTYGPVLMVLACLVPVFIFDAIKLSNRFTGPVFRLRQVTKQLADGELPKEVEFRGADFWKDLAADFNRVVDRLAEQEKQLAESAEKVD